VKSAKAEMTMVAEGYYAVPLVYKIRKKTRSSHAYCQGCL